MKLSDFLKKNGSKKPLALIGVILLLVVALVVWTGGGESAEDVDSGLTYTASYEPFTITINESGSIESQNRVVIKSQVPGSQTIIFLIEEGTMVEEGDLLVELDSSSLEDKLVEEEIELENAQAELISSRENLEVVKNQAAADVAQAELDFRFAKQDLKKYKEGEYEMSLKQAISKITLAQAELQQAEDRLTGSQELYDNRYISATELESDQLAKQRAQMDLELAEQEKRLLETFTYDRQIAQLESDVEQARLALDRAERKARANRAEADARLSARRAEVQREQVSTKELRTRIENCRITAPTDGMVVYAPQGNRWNDNVLEEGLSVRERQELIYLPTAREMIAQIKVHESMLNKLKVGLPATITVDALPGQVFSGSVDEIAVMPEDGGWMNPNLKQYETQITINEVSPGLRSGMTCKAEVLIAHFDKALTVPVQSVLRVDGQPTVFIRGDDGEPIARAVRVGMDNNRKIQILEGLDAGEEVLLAPPLALAERGSPRAASTGGDSVGEKKEKKTPAEKNSDESNGMADPATVQS